MIKIVLCGYRDWAIRIIENVKNNKNVIVLAEFSNHDEFVANIQKFKKDLDFVLFLGWSWIIPKEITNDILCLGIHPSDLPYFRGGSPIQHQITQGVINSKVTLMTLSSHKLDGGDIWLKENLDLTGNSITEIFNHITESSIALLNIFFSQYPNIKPTPQNINIGTYYKRRMPHESRLSIEDFSKLTLEEIYNHIRCLTDPYPNAYIEDVFGNRLIFKHVGYIKAGDARDKKD